MGLSAAVALDVVNTTGMCYYLRENKSRFSQYGSRSNLVFPELIQSFYWTRMNTILDTLILYTVETGATTW